MATRQEKKEFIAYLQKRAAFVEYLRSQDPNYIKITGTRTDAVPPIKPLAGTVNSANHREPTKLNFISTNDVIPVTFGRDRFYPKLRFISSVSNNLYLAYLVGKGEIGGYNAVYVDGVDVDDATNGIKAKGATVNTYVGNNTQNVDSLLVEAEATFADNHRGYAYIVIKIPPNIISGFPRVEVDINGLIIPTYDTHSQFQFTTGTAGSRNLVPYATDASQWTQVGSSTVNDTGLNIANFNKIEIDSGGATTDRRDAVQDETGITTYAITLYYAAGTSGKARIVCRDQTAAVSSICNGTVGSLSVSSSAAGTLVLLEDNDYTDYRIARLLFTPTTPANNMRFGLGPDSATTGQDVIAYGMQVEDAATPNGSSTNPINIMSYLMGHADWSIDSTYQRDAANWENDVLPYDEYPRREVGITYKSPIKLSRLIENSRAYTGCMLAWEAGTALFIPFKDSATLHTLTDDNILALSFSKRQAKESPTVVKVEYRSLSEDFKTKTVVEKVSGVDAGTVPRRVSTVQLPGYVHRGMAKRECVERINERLGDLFMDVQITDEGIEYQVGNVVEVTHLDIFTSKKMIVLGLGMTEPGIWNLKLMEHQTQLFSLAVESEGGAEDTSLPVHVAPGAVTITSLTEEIYQRKNGEYDNRLRVQWSASTSPYVLGYVVRAKEAGVVVSSSQVTGLETTLADIKDSGTVLYTVEVFAYTSLYSGTIASDTITPQGKLAVPGNVSNLTGFEVGGQVRLAWNEAADLDVIGYEIQYGSVSNGWNHASNITLDIIDSLRLITNEVPPGTWEFYVKARDSVGNESATAASVQIEVTLDDSSLLLAEDYFANSATNDLLVHRVRESRNGPQIIYTDNSESWSDLFGGGSISGNTNAVASYQTAPVTNFQHRTAEYDVTYDVSGDWRYTLDWKEYTSGLVVDRVGIKPAGGSYTEYTTLSVKAKGRYTYADFRGLGLARVVTNTDQVGFVVGQQFRIDAITRKESNESTSLASGGKTITLTNEYTAYKNVTITPINVTTGHYYAVDNITVGATTTFVVYIFRSSDDTQQAVDFLWSFEGV